MTPQQLNTMKLALEALEANQPVNYCMNNNGERFPMMQEDPFRFERNTKAITAIKEVLAEHAMSEVQRLGQEIEQEPVISKWVLREVYFDEDGEPVMHRSPPQRTWVGLTGLDQKELMAMSARDAVFATEAKLKEKNT